MHVRSVRVGYLRAQPGCVSLACIERTQSALHVACRVARHNMYGAAWSGREATTKKRKRRRAEGTLRYFLNSPSQAVHIPRWLCVLQSYAPRRKSHPSEFFARRVSLDVISQTTGSPREMAVSVVRYLALLVFYALLQYRKYWQWDSTSAASRLSISSFVSFLVKTFDSRHFASACVICRCDRYVGDRRLICKKRQIKHLKITVSFTRFRYLFLPVYFYKINARGKSEK